ncbi:MAG: four helix bundle protein [Kiritimatiellae bacterium]|nr:four helix bundle protein [Kiritimatiellia bacterium]
MTFEDLDAWKQARKLVSDVYKLTRQDPLSKDFGLRDQLQRAAVSVMTNIAEGFERSTAPDKLHFYNMARASNGEVRSLLYVIEDNFPSQATLAKTIRHSTHDTGRLISGLMASTRKRLAFTTLGVLTCILTASGLFLAFT